MTGEIVQQGHLGGYVAGGDEATFYPELWTWLVHDLGVTSVVDVGCGDGVALRYFRDRLGCVVRGVDGVPQDDPDIVCHDYAESSVARATRLLGEPDALARYEGWNLVWCCEFVEHVEERYIPHFLETFDRAPLVLLTHAGPGQAGYHHVNCRTSDYWVGVLAAIGFRLDATLTEQTRAIAGINSSEWNHYRRSGLAFRRAT